jgi:hypothetical protein
MALIENRKGRDDGGYTRLFGDSLLGQLLSRVQSAVIASGSELERFVIEHTSTLDDVDAFLDMDIIPEGVFVAPKKVLKKSKLIDYADVEPDFVVFERKGKKHHCYLIELKDGDTFDTKKAAGERASLHRFMTAISPYIQFSTSVHFCCFHRDTRAEIVKGFKHKITANEAMTGREFSSLLGIDYDAIITKRTQHQQRNFDCFIDNLLENPAVLRALEVRIGGTVNWDGFRKQPGLFDSGPVVTRRRSSRAV